MVLTVPSMLNVEATYRIEPGQDDQISEEALRSVARLLAFPVLGPPRKTIVRPQVDLVGEPMTRPAKPSGGRVRKGKRRSELVISDYEDVIKELGEEPELFAGQKGSCLAVWKGESDGDTVLVARMSTRDTKGGETGLSQIRTLQNYAERENLRASHVLLATNQPGTVSVDDRIDMSFIMTLLGVRPEAAKGIVYRDYDRMARDTIASLGVVKRMGEFGVAVHLTTTGKLDIERDQLTLGMNAVIAEYEAGRIKERTHRRIIESYMEAGRGAPALNPLGFRRGFDDYLEVDPEQWPCVEMIHTLYPRVSEEGHGLRGLRKELEEAGYKMEVEQIRTVLRNPIYVTGKTTSSWGGTIYEVRPIHLPSPIPSEVFERNQDLLSYARGKQTRNRHGDFLFNRARVLHTRCLTEPEDDAPELEARLTEGRYQYHHKSPVPRCCLRRTFEARPLEAAAIKCLLELVDSPELQAHFITAARREGALRVEASVPRVEELDRRIKNLSRVVGKLERNYRDRASEGQADPVQSREFARAQMSLEAEVRNLRSQRELLTLAEDDTKSLFGRLPSFGEQLTEILTLEPPENTDARQRRALVFSMLVEKVLIREDEDGDVEIELYGPLVSESRPMDLESFNTSVKNALSVDYEPSRQSRHMRRFVMGVPVGFRPAWRSGWRKIER